VRSSCSPTKKGGVAGTKESRAARAIFAIEGEAAVPRGVVEEGEELELREAIVDIGDSYLFA